MDRRRLNHRAAVFVDVDGTLLLHKTRRVNADLLAKIRAKQGQVDFVLWSARGMAYAKSFAQAADIEDLFCAIVAKPTCIVDDEGRLWDRRIKVNTFE